MTLAINKFNELVKNEVPDMTIDYTVNAIEQEVDQKLINFAKMSKSGKHTWKMSHDGDIIKMPTFRIEHESSDLGKLLIFYSDENDRKEIRKRIISDYMLFRF